MSVGAPVIARPRLVQDTWPLWLVFGLFPLWWALGLVLVMWGAAFTLLVVYFFGQRGTLRWPHAFGWWLLFLAWTGISLIRIQDSDRLLAYAYRGASLLAVTALFLYIFNKSEQRLPTALVVRIMAIFWCYVAVGGLIAVVLPTFNFSTPMEYLLPQSLTSNKLISALVHPQAAQLSRVLGFPIGRPVMPFTFTNAWGAAYALAFPFVVLSWRYGGHTWRLVTGGLVILSVIPLVLSLDRGVWLSLGVGLLYAAARLAFARRGKPLVVITAAAIALAAALATTPLGEVVSSRAERGHSDESRLALYTEAIQLAEKSPVLGYGAPQPSSAGPGTPAVGTHGQVWLVLVSVGLPGLLFFLAWYAYMFFATRRRKGPVAFWCHVVVVIAIMQLAVYEQSHAPLAITMVAAALAVRPASHRHDTSGLDKRMPVGGARPDTVTAS